MSNANNLKVSNAIILYPLLFVFFLWIVFWFETVFGYNLNSYGIFPRKLIGLRGIVFSPFIHGSLKHLFNNSVPLFVLTCALFYFFKSVRWKVLLYGLLLTGFATWCIGRASLHIGASGVVYMLVAFLFFRGIFSKHFQLTALSLAVVFLYGGMLWYVFPIDPKISWEGHLSGFFIGIFLALFFKEDLIEHKKYEWEKENYNPESDPFLKQFDHDGNFIEVPKVLPNNIEDDLKPKNIKIIYSFKKNKENKKENL